jgi:hypothetical protein
MFIIFFHKSPAFVHILSQMNPIHALPHSFFKIGLLLPSHLQLGLSRGRFPSYSLTNPVCFSLPSYISQLHCLLHSPWFTHGTEFGVFLHDIFPVSLSSFLDPNILLSTLLSSTPRVNLPQRDRPDFKPMSNSTQSNSSVYSKVYIYKRAWGSVVVKALRY